MGSRYKGYFDYNATTPLSEGVKEAMQEAMEGVANPSSQHSWAQLSKNSITTARKRVADLINAPAERVVFTSGGTEANNTAIAGFLLPHLGKESPGHIVTSAFEHPSVLETIRHYVTRFGFSVSYVNPDHNGVVEPGAFVSQLRDDTVLATLMLANNEIGTIQPVAEIAPVLSSRQIPFHVDAVQAVGKIPVDVSHLRCTSLAISAHKFYGPKGVGALYLKNGVQLKPLMHGGGQEMGLRGGTENTCAIAGAGQAALEARQYLGLWCRHQQQLKDHLCRCLSERVSGVRFNGSLSNQQSVSNTVNVSIPGIRGEALAAILDHQFGMAVTTGSACSNNKQGRHSHVLVAMQMDESSIQSAIRISFGQYTTREDIDELVNAIALVADRLNGIAAPASSKVSSKASSKVNSKVSSRMSAAS